MAPRAIADSGRDGAAGGLLTARETCRLQGLRLHDYLTAAITAALHSQPIPPLLTTPSPP